MGQSRTGRDRVRMRVWLLHCLLIGSFNALLIHDPWRPRPTPSSSGSSGSIRTSGEVGGTSILSGEDAGGESIGGDDIFGKGGRSSSSARTGSSSLIMQPPYTPRRTTPRSIRTSGQAGGTSIFDAQGSAGGTSIFGKSDDDESTESMESNEFDDSDEMIEDELEEVGQAATIEEQVSSLHYETQIKKQTLTRLEAFFEELERRILRLEAANNGTREVTESVPESMTSPAPETTANLPCCQKIKLKSRNRGVSYVDEFLGVYVYNKLEPEDLSGEVDFELFYYEKFSGGGETLSNGCENELAGFNSIHDECGEEKLKFESGFTGSCITGPKLYTVQWYSEAMDVWNEDDTLSIVCVD